MKKIIFISIMFLSLASFQVMNSSTKNSSFNFETTKNTSPSSSETFSQPRNSNDAQNYSILRTQPSSAEQYNKDQFNNQQYSPKIYLPIPTPGSGLQGDPMDPSQRPNSSTIPRYIPSN